MSKNFVNQLLNLFWTALFFAPLLWYWQRTGLDSLWYLFLTVSAIPIFLPYKLLGKITFFDRPSLYERSGVKIIRWFAQDGTWAS
jgi:hypothetical protein